MPSPFRTTRRVEFRDTDAAGVMHFSAFFVYMEEVEHEYLRSLGLSVMFEDELGPISWPRVAARCDYQGSVKFEDVLDIELQLVRIGEKSLTYECGFTHQGHPKAVGQITAVCCRLEKGSLQSIPIPESVLSKLPAVPQASG